MELKSIATVANGTSSRLWLMSEDKAMVVMTEDLYFGNAFCILNAIRPGMEIPAAY